MQTENFWTVSQIHLMSQDPQTDLHKATTTAVAAD